MKGQNSNVSGNQLFYLVMYLSGPVQAMFNDVFAHLQLSRTKTECKNWKHIGREKSSSHILDLEAQTFYTNLEQKVYWMGMTGSSFLCLLSYYTLAEPWELVWHSGDISPPLKREKTEKKKNQTLPNSDPCASICIQC